MEVARKLIGPARAVLRKGVEYGDPLVESAVAA